MKKSLTALAMLLAATGAPRAQGEIPINPVLQDRWYFALGAFFPRTTTEAQLDSTTLGAGTVIDFERALGMQESKTVPSAMARVRLGERWRIEAEFFQLNRSGERVVDRQIEWGDAVFPVNARVASSFDFYDLRVSAGYAFFRRPDKELGVGLGLHVAAYDVGLRADAIGDEQEDVLAPLPVLSLYGQFALTERWAIGSRLDRFSLKYDKYNGSLGALGIDLTYQPWRHAGIGIAYRALFIRMEAEENGRLLKFQQTFNGPLLFLNASF
jgi:hypothetical protein